MEYKDRLIEENNELIADILKRNYYTEFVKDDSKKNIELIINRNNISSKCYGCFNDTEKEMYPHINFSENNYDKIYNNFLAFAKMYNTNNWKCPIEINGLDWINTDFYNKILLILKQYFSNKKIIINIDLGILKNINFYNELNSLGVDLFLNIYANGLYCDDNDYNENYYNKLINFIKTIKKDKFKIISHIRPSNVKNWEKNYNWWIDKLGELAFTNIELREEKTENWTYELISEYVLFLKHQINFLLNTYNEDIFTKIIFNKQNTIIFQNISLLENKYLINENKNNNCNFFKNLTIDLTTMNIVPCAKINYEDFACGQYIIENNEIKEIKAKNIPIVIFNTHLKQACMPHCEVCKHLEFCSGHCLGESYNKCYDMAVPIREFCDLSKAKINFLIHVYDELNLLTKNKLLELNCNELYIQTIIDLKSQMKEVL